MEPGRTEFDRRTACARAGSAWGTATLGLALGLLPIRAWSGAWVREAGEVYAKAGFTQMTSDETYDAKGKKVPAPDFTDTSLNLYAEYGLSPNWTGILSLPFKLLVREPAGGQQETSGLGDVWFQFKRRLNGDGRYPLALQGGVKVPGGYSASADPPLGQGQADLEVKFLAGASLPKNAYASAEAGYRLRDGAYSDEVPYLVEAGIRPWKWGFFKLALDGVHNLSNDTASDLNRPNTDPNVFDKEYMNLMGEFVYFLPKGFSLAASYGEVVDGANTAAGPTWGLALAWQGRP